MSHGKILVGWKMLRESFKRFVICPQVNIIFMNKFYMRIKLIQTSFPLVFIFSTHHISLM